MQKIRCQCENNTFELFDNMVSNMLNNPAEMGQLIWTDENICMNTTSQILGSVRFFNALELSYTH